MNIDYTLFTYLCIAITITTICTIVGAGAVFFLRKPKLKLSCVCIGFTAGVMLAGSFFSLILPAIELCPDNTRSKLLSIIIGLTAGFIFMILCDNPFKRHNTFSPKMMFLAITLHNIPESMCMGLAFAGNSAISLAGAIALAIGIGIQNIPEGASVSLPMLAYTKKKGVSFIFGVISALVEPIGAILAFFFASTITAVLPALLCFAGSCMIYVVLSDMTPHSVAINKPIATISMSIGFILMTLLDCLL